MLPKPPYHRKRSFSGMHKRKFSIADVEQTRITLFAKQAPEGQSITLWPVGRLRTFPLTYTPRLYWSVVIELAG